MKAPNTAWLCRQCGTSGLVTIEEGVGVYEGCSIVMGAHSGSGCDGDLADIHVVPVEFRVVARVGGEPSAEAGQPAGDGEGAGGSRYPSGPVYPLPTDTSSNARRPADGD